MFHHTLLHSDSEEKRTSMCNHKDIGTGGFLSTIAVQTWDRTGEKETFNVLLDGGTDVTQETKFSH